MYIHKRGAVRSGLPPFCKLPLTDHSYKRVDALDNLTFIGFSLIGFVIIFLLLRILPRIRAKRSDHSKMQHPSRLPNQQTGTKRVYKI